MSSSSYMLPLLFARGSVYALDDTATLNGLLYGEESFLRSEGDLGLRNLSQSPTRLPTQLPGCGSIIHERMSSFSLARQFGPTLFSDAGIPAYLYLWAWSMGSISVEYDPIALSIYQCHSFCPSLSQIPPWLRCCYGEVRPL